MKNRNIKTLAVIAVIALNGCSNGTAPVETTRDDETAPFDAARVEIVDIVFADTTLRNCVAKTGLEYADEVKALSCFGVSNAGGIESLVELENLKLINSQLTALDLSANTALTVLDVSTNTALKNLYASYNQLTALDLSTNTALEVLNALNSQLTTLDVSANTALTYLIIDRNVACTGVACP